MAELPHWPHGLALPGGVPKPRRRAKGAAVLAWAPPKTKRIRAVLLIVANSDSKHFGEHLAVREVAAKHEMGIVYFRYPAHADLPKNPSSKTMDRLLDSVAAKTGIKEFSHAPWVTFGKSSVGKFPYYLAWAFPRRVVATISYHAEPATWPPATWARLGGETILHVSLNGEIARKKAGSGQSPGRQGPPTDAPVIRKATDVKQAERKNMFWVADRELAEAWLRLHARKF